MAYRVRTVPKKKRRMMQQGGISKGALWLQVIESCLRTRLLKSAFPAVSTTVQGGGSEDQREFEPGLSSHSFGSPLFRAFGLHGSNSRMERNPLQFGIATPRNSSLVSFLTS